MITDEMYLGERQIKMLEFKRTDGAPISMAFLSVQNPEGNWEEEDRHISHDGKEIVYFWFEPKQTGTYNLEVKVAYQDGQRWIAPMRIQVRGGRD